MLLTEKYAEILESAKMPAIKASEKPNVALLLENQATEEARLMTEGTVASDVAQFTPIFMPLARRVQPALIANVGWEYRTEEKGIWYIGGSFHRPFLPMYKATVGYVTDTYTNNTETNLTGNYLTLDLRYFFHEEPVKPLTRKQRKKQKEEEQKQKDVFYRPGIDGKK